MARLPVLVLAIALLSACGRAPSRAEALRVLREARPALDTLPVVARVWRDGPPWFSCAEVIAKFRGLTDRAVVRDQVGNWRWLVLANWAVLRDTTAGQVTEPGWCEVSLSADSVRRAAGWRPVLGDTWATGARRRGWDVPAGRQHLVVRDAPKKVGNDSVAVNYLVTVKPNVNGVGIGADRDTTRRRALLRREDGTWTLLDDDWRAAAAPKR